MIKSRKLQIDLLKSRSRGDSVGIDQLRVDLNNSERLMELEQTRGLISLGER